MMRFTLLFLFCLSCSSPTADPAPEPTWQEKEFVNDFGEPTGEYYLSAQVEGTRDGVPCTVDIIKSSDFISFQFFDGDVMRPIFSKGFVPVQIKSGSVIDTVRMFVTKNRVTDTDGDALRILQNNQSPSRLLIDLGLLGGVDRERYLFTVPVGG